MLNPQEIQQARQQYNIDGLKNQQQTANQSGEDYDTMMKRLGNLIGKTPTQPSQPGIGSALGQFASNVGQDVMKRGQNIINTIKNPVITQQNGKSVYHPIETGLQATGQLAGGINDILGEGIKSFVLPTAKANIKDYVPQTIQNLLHPVAQQGLQALAKGANSYNQWAQNNPRVSKDLESAFNIASLLPVAKGGEAAGEAIGQVGEGLGEAAQAAKQSVADTVGGIKKSVGSVSDLVTPMDKGVQNELIRGELEGNIGKQQQIIDRYKEYAQQAHKAIGDYSQPTPMELAGNKGEEALNSLKNQMKSAGQEKQAALAQNGHKIVETQPSFQKFGDLLEQRLGTTIDHNNNFINAPGRKSIITGSSSDSKLVTKVFNTLGDLGNKPTLQQVNDAIDGIQSDLYKSRVIGAEPINTKTESVVKQVIGDLNNRAKEVGGDAYKNANAKYADLVDTHHTLNKALGVDSNKGASLMKQLFSPNGTMPRKLFSEIKNKTGIDLVNEATLAKHAMENVGDIRQASLLSKVITGELHPSPKGIIGHIVSKGIEKLQNPVAKAERMAQGALERMKK